MAKINEEIIVIKISTLLPDQADMTPVMGAEQIDAIRQVIQEFAGDSRTLVEIERA
jgi:malonyl CoA-acyl carrier protein transacylase